MDKISGVTQGITLRRQPMGVGCEPFVDEQHLREMRQEIQTAYSYGTVIYLYYKYSGQGSISPQDPTDPNYDPFSENNLTYEAPIQIQGYFEPNVSEELFTSIGSDEDITAVVRFNRDDADTASIMPSTGDLVVLKDLGTEVNNDFLKYLGVKLKITGVNRTSVWRSTAHWFTMGVAPFNVNFSSSIDVPAIDFVADVVAGSYPLTVEFTSSNTGGPIDNYYWDFGDGNLSNDANPSHSYTAPGTYTVNLEVDGSGGYNFKTQTDYITVS